MPQDRSRLPDEYPQGAHTAPQGFYETGPRAGTPAGRSTKVGWSLRNSAGQITAAFAFLINPQGITRRLGSRASLYATQDSFYVDDFGPAPTQIQIRQLVGDGKDLPGDLFYTGREDIQRFITDIYVPATHGPQADPPRVYFHDSHLERGMEEHVFFPADSLTVERSVDQHNVWRVDLSMIVLERFPYQDLAVQATHGAAPGIVQGDRIGYTVRAGDTLGRLAAGIAGPKATAAKRKQVLARVLELNPQIRQRRLIEQGGTAITGLPMHVYPGEHLELPT